MDFDGLCVYLPYHIQLKRPMLTTTRRHALLKILYAVCYPPCLHGPFCSHPKSGFDIRPAHSILIKGVLSALYLRDTSRSTFFHGSKSALFVFTQIVPFGRGRRHHLGHKKVRENVLMAKQFGVL